MRPGARRWRGPAETKDHPVRGSGPGGHGRRAGSAALVAGGANQGAGEGLVDGATVGFAVGWAVGIGPVPGGKTSGMGRP